LIPARKNAFLDQLLYLYLIRRLRRQFYSIEVKGLEHLQNLDPDHGSIAFANHSNWWDGLAIFFLTRHQKQKSFYCMMEEKQLRHYAFFTWIGAFGVDLSNRLQSALSIRYATRLLKDPRALVWIFPQGEMISPRDAIAVKPGTHFLASRYPVTQLLPVCFRYEFIKEDRPQIYIQFAPPFSAAESSDEKIQSALQTLCEDLDQSIRTRDFQNFKTLLRPSLSINKRWEWFTLLLKGRLHEFDARN
jgi:1-acyl-sn-glycerol-3-phosphate acyltransferase